MSSVYSRVVGFSQPKKRHGICVEGDSTESNLRIDVPSFLGELSGSYEFQVDYPEGLKALILALLRVQDPETEHGENF